MTADIVSLTEFKKNPRRTIKHAADSRRPVLFTSHGRGVAVVEAIADYERKEIARATPQVVFLNHLSQLRFYVPFLVPFWAAVTAATERHLPYPQGPIPRLAIGDASAERPPRTC